MTQEESLEDQIQREVHELNRDLKVFNEQFIVDLGEEYVQDFKSLVSDVYVVGKLSIVSKPEGQLQHEVYDKFINVYVDQYTSNEDCYSGFIYAQIDKNKWIKVPYEC